MAAGHARAGEHATTSLDGDLAALHARAELRARMTFDNNLAAGKSRADLVATGIGANEVNTRRIVALDLEGVANGALGARRADRQRFDLLAAELRQSLRRERRQVEPLIGLGFQLEG